MVAVLLPSSSSLCLHQPAGLYLQTYFDIPFLRCTMTTPCRPPILIVIAIATLMSTAASMAGGLIMYFESLASLEETVRDTSQSEVKSLEGEIRGVLDQTADVAEVVRAFTYNTESVTSTDPSVWINQSRALSFSLTRSLGIFAVGYVLLPHDLDDNSAVFHLVWMEEQHNGELEIMHGRYHENLLPSSEYFKVNTSATPPQPTDMTIKTNRINTVTGELMDFMYNWNAVSYILDMLPPSYDPRGGQVPSEEWKPGRAHAVAHKWRTPLSWRSSDEKVYTYSGYDSVYAPPAAPHPWSKYRAVVILSQYTYNKWDSAIMEYKSRNPDTTVVVFGSESKIVFAATTGDKMVNELCNTGRKEFSVTDPLSCATKVDTVESPAFRDAYRKMADEPFNTFKQLSLDGEDYFVRKGGQLHQDAVIIWMRPKSSVEGKVNEALVLLVVFTALVFAFDLMVSVLEVIFIALPMRRLASAIHHVGDLETEVAAAAIAPYEKAHVVVREIHSLMNGMMRSIERLEEFRTFMPDSLRPAAAFSTDDEDKGDTASKDTTSKSGMQSSVVSVEQTGQLGLYLVNKSVGLLYVNAVGWWQTDTSTEDLLRASTELASFVLQSVATRCGVLDSFSGDRFLVGWNTAKHGCEPAMGAANTAMDLLARTSSPRREFSCALASGSAKVGNVGTATVRRFSILSPLVPWLSVLETYCKVNMLGCVTDEPTSNRITKIVVRVTNAIVKPKQMTVMPVFHLTDRADENVQEWMYELDEMQQKENVTEVRAANSIALLIIHEKWSEAQRKYETMQNKDNLPAVWKKALEEDEFFPQQLSFNACSDKRSQP